MTRVQVVEVSARDGLQNDPAFLTTEQKVELIKRTVDAGIDRAEVASFANPKAVLFFTAVLPPFMDVTRPAAPQLALFALATIGMDVLTMSAYGLGGAALARRMSEPRFRKGFALLTGILLLAAAVLIISRL